MMNGHLKQEEMQLSRIIFFSKMLSVIHLLLQVGLQLVKDVMAGLFGKMMIISQLIFIEKRKIDTCKI